MPCTCIVGNSTLIWSKTLPHLALPHSKVLNTARKLPGFDDELIAGFPPLHPSTFLKKPVCSEGASMRWDNFPIVDDPRAIVW